MTDPVLVLREALAKATEGPWESAYAPRDDDPRKKATFHADLLTNDVEQPLWIVWTRDGSTDVDYVVPAVTGDGPTSRANAEFVAAARNLLPVLLDEVEALRTRNEKLNEIYERHTAGLQRERDDAEAEVEALRKVVADVRALPAEWSAQADQIERVRGAIAEHRYRIIVRRNLAAELARLLAVLDKEEEK